MMDVRAYTDVFEMLDALLLHVRETGDRVLPAGGECQPETEGFVAFSMVEGRAREVLFQLGWEAAILSLEEKIQAGGASGERAERLLRSFKTIRGRALYAATIPGQKRA